jgi:hypothetical protein
MKTLILVNVIVLFIIIFMLQNNKYDFFKGEKVDENPVGKVLHIETIDSSLSRIETEEAILVIRGHLSYIKGAKAKIITYKSGSEFLCFDSKKRCLKIVN